MVQSKGKRWLRDKLFRENPYCPICNVKMIHPSELPTDRRGNIKNFPENTVSLKRKFSRYDGYERSQNNEPATIMCQKCVRKLSNTLEREVDIEVRRLRSSRAKGIKKWTKF